MAPGLIIAAPSSGSGKTTLTLALLRHLAASGVAVASLKVGPDYIDPAFHTRASGRTCLNLDLWAMRRSTVEATLERASRDADVIIAEGVMGLFDGAVTDEGSTADVAALTGWPVVLVVDARGMSASVGALVRGFATHRQDVRVAGVICNRIGSERHRHMLESALEPLGIPLLGALRRDSDLGLPDRHLGLVQAGEHPDLEAFLTHAAEAVSRQVDVPALLALATPGIRSQREPSVQMPPPGQRVAVASDIAFAFHYPAMLDGWRDNGAEVSFFSPLADEAPAADADAVFLPGGYPELHAGHLSACTRFMDGLRAGAARGALVYGECGGYMTLGDALIDRDGQAHRMAGLLPVTTSFASPRLTLGYRALTLAAQVPLGNGARAFRGHEFHFASVVDGASSAPLFHATSARGDELHPMGSCVGNVMGSFAHLIDLA